VKILAVLIVLVAASTASAATLPHLRTCAGANVVKPKGAFTLSCADANSQLDHTAWKTWTSTSATGTTTFGLNLCTPYCAASKMSFFPHSSVKLDRARNGRFTRVTVHYVLHGKTKTFVQD
jgi:hypothetical protein